MSILKAITVTTALVLSSSVNAALIDYGNFTTDDVNNIEWLDLTFTDGLSYSAALSAVSAVEGGGWEYATQQQMNSMWSQVFLSGWTPNSAGYQISTYHAVEVDRFSSLFGITNDRVTTTETFGWYVNDSGILRTTGVRTNWPTDEYDVLYGPEYSDDNLDSLLIYGSPMVGTYLVRSTVVPVPAAVWLFGSGLIGLIGFARKKSHA